MPSSLIAPSPTATLLAQIIVRQGLKNVAAGANPLALRRGIETAVDDVVEGDEVLYSKYGGTEITVEGEDLLVLRESDVLAKVTG